MLLNLTDLSDEPLQGQIVRQIRAKILAGDLMAGAALPSIRALAREQHISVITVQRAYEALEREGLVQSRRRRGFYVSALSDDKKMEIAEARLQERLGPIVQTAVAEGLTPEDVLEIVARILEQKQMSRES